MRRHPKRSVLFLACALLVPAILPAPEPLLRGRLFPLDTAHSVLDFTIRLAGLAKVRGTFTRYQGAIYYDETDITGSSVTVVIQSASINTGIAQRDDHLRTPDFFDAEKFPTLRFQSRRLERAPDGLRAIGDLSIRGVTKEVVLPFRLLAPPAPDPWGNQRVTFEGALSLNRKDFGIVGPRFWSQALSDQVEIEFTASGRIYNYEGILFDSQEKKSIGELLLETATARGGPAARAQFFQLRRDEPGNYRFSFWGVFLAGLRLHQQGRNLDAVALFELAAEAFPEERLGSVYQALAEAYAGLGQRDEALRYCQKILELEPDRPEAIELRRRLQTD